MDEFYGKIILLKKKKFSEKMIFTDEQEIEIKVILVDRNYWVYQVS
jgi:hypothetical protein